MDVSSYLVNAAIRQMAETDAVEAEFAGIDALIADAEAHAADHAPDSAPEPEGLTETEQRAVDDAMRLVHGVEEAPPRNRGEVA